MYRNQAASTIEPQKSRSVPGHIPIFLPYETIAQNIHEGDIRDEGIQYYIHMQRMADQFRHLVRPHPSDKETSLIRAIYGVIYLHDADETLQKKGKLVGSWKGDLQQIETDPESLEYMMRSLEVFRSANGGSVYDFVTSIPEDPTVRFITSLTKELDIHDNSYTKRKYAGENKTLERIMKVQDYQDYVRTAAREILQNAAAQILYKREFSALVERTHKNLLMLNTLYLQELGLPIGQRESFK